MRSDTDGPNRLPGNSRLTLLRSNTGMSSVGLVAACRVACRAPRLVRYVLDELTALGVSGDGRCRVRKELWSAVPSVSVDRAVRLRAADPEGSVAIGSLHIAPFYAISKLSKTSR